MHIFSYGILDGFQLRFFVHILLAYRAFHLVEVVLKVLLHLNALFLHLFKSLLSSVLKVVNLSLPLDLSLKNINCLTHNSAVHLTDWVFTVATLY